MYTVVHKKNSPEMPKSRNNEVCAAAAVYASGKGMNTISAPTKTYTVRAGSVKKKALAHGAEHLSI